MKKRILATAAVVLVSSVSFFAWAATIRVFRFHGSTCVPTNASRNSVDYGTFGIHNISSASAGVVCPLPTNNSTSANETLTGMTAVAVYDRNSTADVTCTMQNQSGSFTQTLSTSGSSPAEMTLLFNPGGQSVQDIWFLTCSIPGVQSGSYSHIARTTVTSQF
jgi:hypothetical protein